MVALKLEKILKAHQLKDPKQERRGGIETVAFNPTEANLLKEAGTPWWH